MENEQFKNYTEAFEQALAERDAQHYYFRLYIAGMTSRSISAIENIKKICDDRIHGGYRLEIIDIYQQPGIGKKDNIVAVPTLIKILPTPLQRIVGDMSQTEEIILELDLVPTTYQK